MASGCRVDLIACPQCGYHSLPGEHDHARPHPADVADPGHAVGHSGTADSLAAPGEVGGDVALCSGAMPLSELRSGSRARLLGFRGIDDNYLGRLTAYGMLPGVSIEVLQRFPAIILGVYQAELALETELAEGIWVLPA